MSNDNTPLPSSQAEQDLRFPELTQKLLTANFQGGQVSSDGGGILLAQLDRSYGYTRRLATCFHDDRDPDAIEHPLLVLLRQRIYGLGLGYADLNDHDQVRADVLFASLCGKADPLGQDRQREQDKGKALAGKSTLNRLELTPADAGPESRYKKILADPVALEDYLIDEWVRSLSKATRAVTLDLDRTNDTLSGQQEGRFFHGYYDEYGYTPLYIFDGDWPVGAALHTGDSEHQDEILRLVAKILERLHRRCPRAKLRLRGDRGFCRDGLLAWCEAHGVEYVFGLAGNAVLKRLLRGSLRVAKSMLDFNQSAQERVFKDLRYRAQSWGRQKRRVVGKAEWTRAGANPRFVITNVKREDCPGQALYEQDYCGRGNMENRIKEQKLDRFSGRTSTATLRTNQLRLWFSTVAYLIVNQLRRVGLAGTELATATCGTIRVRLFKIGAVVAVTVRRVWVKLSSAFPLQALFGQAAAQVSVPASG